MLNQKCVCGGVYLHKNKSSHKKKNIDYIFVIKIKFNYDWNAISQYV